MPTEDVTTMLNQLHAASDIAADHRRTLHAEAEVYRLARTARRGAAGDRPAARSRTGLAVLRLLVRRPTRSPA